MTDDLREQFEKWARWSGLAFYLAHEQDRGYLDADTWKAFKAYQGGAASSSQELLRLREDKEFYSSTKAEWKVRAERAEAEVERFCQQLEAEHAADLETHAAIEKMEAEVERLRMAIRETIVIIPWSMGGHVTLGLNILQKALREEAALASSSETPKEQR